jgi:hypothetical protein
MIHSPYFYSLAEIYRADLHDLQFDSLGDDILEERLNEKRGLLISLLPLMREMPELLLPAFNDGFTFKNTHALDALIRLSPGRFPPWIELATAVTLSPWVADSVDHVLNQEGGDDFMALAVGINYLCDQRYRSQGADAESADEQDANDERDEVGSDRDYEANHEEGNRWLEEQGFDKGGRE